jgi:hypothetical protein
MKADRRLIQGSSADIIRDPSVVKGNDPPNTLNTPKKKELTAKSEPFASFGVFGR